MSSRQQIDSVIDDDDEFWYVLPLLHRNLIRFVLTAPLSPLCIEEFDLSDKNFRPCPCGYQVINNTLQPSCILLPVCNHLPCAQINTDIIVPRSANFVTTISRPTATRVDALTAGAFTMRAPYNTKSLMQTSKSFVLQCCYYFMRGSWH